MDHLAKGSEHEPLETSTISLNITKVSAKRIFISIVAASSLALHILCTYDGE
jgi:hypothetical protein